MQRLLYALTFVCFMLSAAVRAEAASVTLAWDPNTESDLAGYTVLFGTQPGGYDRVVEVGNFTTWTFNQAEINKTYYFVVQAVNTTGARSEYSAEIAVTVTDSGPIVNQPKPPANGPRLSVNRTSLSFGAIAGNNGLRSGAQRAAVSFSNGTSNWTATTDASWLQITGGAGTGPGAINLTIKSGTYAPSTLVGSITLTAPNAVNSPVTIPVTLRVVGSGENPFGIIDTPVDNAVGIRGSIAITGWASDDVGLKEVMIYRDAVASEAGGQLFVGRAVFVDGARPDVDASIAQPFDYQAGWGYMLLTRMLPNGGNGTFRLHAYATDVEGRTVLIGSRTITCDNAKATKPFGAIDTPDQGATISGTYMNFGWALTPQPNFIRNDGSTIMVYIDGVPVGRPVYNNWRADIGTRFLGFANSGGAIGYLPIDTTTLANGVHTISWAVTDSAGNAEGIGSRYFNVLNGSSTSTMTLEASTSIQEMSGGGAETRVSAAIGSSSGLDAASVDSIPVSVVPVYRRDGFDQNASLELAAADESGIVRVNVETAGRLTLALSSPIPEGRGGYEGYLVADGKLQALPAGSFLDQHNGEFYWQPGVGFVGTYQLVFIRTANDQRVRIPVEVNIGQSTLQSKPKMFVDMPSANGIVGTSFVAAGWAADFGAATGTGVRTVHAWAYPTTPGSDPIFVGEAVMGVDRPDVGIAHGSQYDHAGFYVSGTLAPGSYNLVVYAFSEIAKAFNNAIMVPIIVK